MTGFRGSSKTPAGKRGGVFGGTPGLGARAYSYAKASGIIGKSFLGKRLRNLESAARLSELDRLVFPDSSQNLPEKELLIDLENRIIGRSVKSIVTIVECFPKVPEFFALLVRSYEYADLKNVLAAALAKEESAPVCTDIKQFRTVRFDAWPDIGAMLGGTEFEFLLDKKSGLLEGRSLLLQTALDRLYYTKLWNALFLLPRGDRRAAERILGDEISLKNAGWALRLRVYYNMSADEVKPHLIDIPANGKARQKAGSASLADEALRSLDFPLDNYAAWSSWRWREFLGRETGGRDWKADPRQFENAAARYLFDLARRSFRRRPSSLDSIFCFIKLKQFEEDILTSNAEGLGMGMSGRDVFSLMGVEA